MISTLFFWIKIGLAVFALVGLIVYLVRPGPMKRLRRHLESQGIRARRIRRAEPGMMEAVGRQWPKYEALYTDAQGDNHCARFDVGPWSVELLEDRVTSTRAQREAMGFVVISAEQLAVMDEARDYDAASSYNWLNAELARLDEEMQTGKSMRVDAQDRIETFTTRQEFIAWMTHRYPMATQPSDQVP